MTVMRARLLCPILLAIAGCGASDGGARSKNVVEVEATTTFAFAPAHLTVPLGTTVRWTNEGTVPHTITSGASSQPSDHPGALLDRPLPGGGAVELTFTTPGDWPYFCRYHEGMGMVGLVTVTVEGGGADGLAMAATRRGTERPGQRWVGERR